MIQNREHTVIKATPLSTQKPRTLWLRKEGMIRFSPRIPAHGAWGQYQGAIAGRNANILGLPHGQTLNPRPDKRRYTVVKQPWQPVSELLSVGEDATCVVAVRGKTVHPPAMRLKGAMAKVAEVRMMSSRMSRLRLESSSMLIYSSVSCTPAGPASVELL